jgi:hypothetical protein
VVNTSGQLRCTQGHEGRCAVESFSRKANASSATTAALRPSAGSNLRRHRQHTHSSMSRSQLIQPTREREKVCVCVCVVWCA